MDVILVVTFAIALLVVVYLISPLLAPKAFSFGGSHVLVTGGSLGIGLAVAKEAFRRGADVTIVARGEVNLKAAKAAILSMKPLIPSQQVCSISLDVANPDDVPLAFQRSIDEIGPIDMLVNCAGTATSALFEHTPDQEFHRLMKINYFGSVYGTKFVVPLMKQRRIGRIVFVSSQAGQVGLYGFSAYSATKFALRGFAEALEMELKPYNIAVTLAHPPDTDTPGFKEEEKTKPEITKAICQTGGLYSADRVARILLDDAQSGKFMSFVGIDGFMLASVSAGMSPVISLTEPLLQFFFTGFLRSIGLVYRRYFDYIVKRSLNKVKST